MNHQIDSLAYTNRLRGLPPSHKLSFAIALLILSLVSGAIVELSIGLWLAVWIVVYAGIPGKLYLRLLSLPLMFLLTSLPALAMGAVELSQIPQIQWDIWQGWGLSTGTFKLYVFHPLDGSIYRNLANSQTITLSRVGHRTAITNVSVYF